MTAEYAFMVHNRMLVVIIAVVLCLIVLWITHKINWKVLAAFGMAAVASYGEKLPQTGDKIRIAPAFYGRYNECIFPLLILMAIVFMFQRMRCERKVYIIVFASFIFLSVIMYIRLCGIDNGYINIVSSIGIHMFHWLGEFSVLKCFGIAIFVFAAADLLCYFRFPKQCNYYLVCLMLIFLFSTTALYCMKLTIRGENDNTARYSALFDYLNTKTQKHDIVYMCDENKMAFDVQIRHVDKTVICVTTEQLEGLIEDNYAVIRENQAGELNITDYSVCLETEGYMLIKAE